MNHGWRVGRMPPTQHCIIFPNVTGASQHYFLDTGLVLDQHSAPVIISDVAVIEMAKLFGFISKGEAQQMQQKLNEKEDIINGLLQKIDDLEQFKAAVKLISNEKKKALQEAGA